MVFDFYFVHHSPDLFPLSRLGRLYPPSYRIHIKTDVSQWNTRLEG